MKQLINGLLLSIIMLTGLQSNAQQDKKAAQARKEIAEAKEDLREAKIDSAADYQIFIQDAEMAISENKKAIANLKLKKQEATQEANIKYTKKVQALENKNLELEKQINASGHTKSTKWTRFKANFNAEMEKLGKAIHNL
jgi:hypothetical protein